MDDTRSTNGTGVRRAAHRTWELPRRPAGRHGAPASPDPASGAGGIAAEVARATERLMGWDVRPDAGEADERVVRRHPAPPRFSALPVGAAAWFDEIAPSPPRPVGAAPIDVGRGIGDA